MRLNLSELDDLVGLLSEFWLTQADEQLPDGASLVVGWTSAYGSEPSFRADLSDALLYYPSLLLLDPLANFFDDRSALPTARGIRYRRRDGMDNVVHSGPEIWSRNDAYESMRKDPKSAAARFARIVDNLYSLEEPIREGVVVLRSQWPVLARRRVQLESAFRHDAGSKDLQEFIASIPPNEVGPMAWDNLQGSGVSIRDPIRPSDAKWRAEPYFYYVDKT